MPRIRRFRDPGVRVKSNNGISKTIEYIIPVEEVSSYFLSKLFYLLTLELLVRNKRI